MKKLSFTMIFACCVLAMVAQDVIRVNYRGAKPTISDFAWAYVVAVDKIEECGDKPSNAIKEAMTRQRKGLPQEEDVTFVVNKNTGKFHRPDCDSVKEMKQKNRWDFTGSREELIEEGYSPCGACRP